jgi:hypothetical protein
MRLNVHFFLCSLCLCGEIFLFLIIFSIVQMMQAERVHLEHPDVACCGRLAPHFFRQKSKKENPKYV